MFQLGGILLILSFAAHAEWDMVLRADQYEPYRLPVLSLMPNMDVACSDSGVGVRYWVKTDDGVVSHIGHLQGNQFSSSRAFPESMVLSQPQLTTSGLLFSANTQHKTHGLYTLESGETRALTVSDELMQSRSLTAPKPYKGGVLVRRLRHDGIYELYLDEEKLVGEDSHGLSHIFLPQARNDSAVFKLSTGEPDEVPANGSAYLAMLTWDHARVIMVNDRKRRPLSPFIRFDNSPQPLGDSGLVFIAEHATHGRSLWVKKELDFVLLAKESEGPVTEIEFFAPAANPRGDILFRGKNEKGQRAVFYVNFRQSSPQAPVSILSEGESLITNEGVSRVIDREGWPAFSGRPCVTDQGQAVLHVVLESLNGQVNHGSGIFVQDLANF